MWRRVLDAVRLQRRHRQHGDPDGLVAHQLFEPGHVEDPAGREVVEVLLERLQRVQVVLAQREALGGVGAERVGEPDVDLVVGRVAVGEDRPAVADPGRHAGAGIGRARQVAEVVVDHVADGRVQLDHVDGLVRGQRVVDVAPPPPPITRAWPGPATS